MHSPHIIAPHSLITFPNLCKPEITFLLSNNNHAKSRNSDCTHHTILGGSPRHRKAATHYAHRRHDHRLNQADYHLHNLCCHQSSHADSLLANRPRDRWCGTVHSHQVKSRCRLRFHHLTSPRDNPRPGYSPRQAANHLANRVHPCQSRTM